jgi:uncharacterized membrane-anchored protein YhcB (DUF1043 family)
MGGSFDVSWVWGIGLISFACGIAFGLGISFLVRGDRRRVRELEREFTDLQREFDHYREQVSEHFLTTSELVQKMTDSYRDVYEHLAGGSQVLCQNPVSTPSLDFTQKPVIETSFENPSEEDSEQTPGQRRTDPPEDGESDTCFGDAPHVPSLDSEQPASPRISSP